QPLYSALFLLQCTSLPLALPPLFPYPTLFRSGGGAHRPAAADGPPAGGGAAGPGDRRHHPAAGAAGAGERGRGGLRGPVHGGPQDRKSTRLNSSHVKISYADVRLKKKTKKRKP